MQLPYLPQRFRSKWTARTIVPQQESVEMLRKRNSSKMRIGSKGCLIETDASRFLTLNDYVNRRRQLFSRG